MPKLTPLNRARLGPTKIALQIRIYFINLAYDCKDAGKGPSNQLIISTK